MADDERVQVGDYSFPPGAEVLEHLAYTIPYGDDETEDIKWEGYVDVAHGLGVESIETEIIDSGVLNDVQFAVAKVTVKTDGGNTYSAVQAADETTNQVRQPEFVWSVAESRALKRAVKKAFNIYPTSKDASEEPDPVDSSGPEKPSGVEYEDGHALSDEYDEAAGGGDGGGADW